MWFLRIAEELSNVVPVNRSRSYLLWFLRIADELSIMVLIAEELYLMWFLRIAEKSYLM